MPPAEPRQLSLLAEIDRIQTAGRGRRGQCYHCRGPLEAADGHYHTYRPLSAAFAGQPELVCCSCRGARQLGRCAMSEELAATQPSSSGQ